MDRESLNSLIRGHCLEMKDMIAGLDGTEPEPPDPIRLDFMDPVAGFQLAVYLEEELDVLLAEPLSTFKGGTSDDLTEFVLQNRPELLSHREGNDETVIGSEEQCAYSS